MYTDGVTQDFRGLGRAIGENALKDVHEALDRVVSVASEHLASRTDDCLLLACDAFGKEGICAIE